jgi:hypothetical protein
VSALSQLERTPAGKVTIVTKGDAAAILGRMRLFGPQRTLRMLGDHRLKTAPSGRNQPSSAINAARGSGQKVYPWASEQLGETGVKSRIKRG